MWSLEENGASSETGYPKHISLNKMFMVPIKQLIENTNNQQNILITLVNKEGINMQYGNALGAATGGGMAVFGIKMGYGWLVLGTLFVTILIIKLIRTYFRRNKSIGDI